MRRSLSGWIPMATIFLWFRKKISVPKEAEAPVVVGTKAGEAIYRLNGEQIGTVPILYASNVEKAFYRDYVKKAVTAFLL